MIKELEQVVLTVDIDDYGLCRGDIGTVVMVHDARGYEVEFVALDGETIAVTSLTVDQVRSIGQHEIAHARSLEAVSG